MSTLIAKRQAEGNVVSAWAQWASVPTPSSHNKQGNLMRASMP